MPSVHPSISASRIWHELSFFSLMMARKFFFISGFIRNEKVVLGLVLDFMVYTLSKVINKTLDNCIIQRFSCVSTDSELCFNCCLNCWDTGVLLTENYA